MCVCDLMNSLSSRSTRHQAMLTPWEQTFNDPTYFSEVLQRVFLMLLSDSGSHRPPFGGHARHKP